MKKIDTKSVIIGVLFSIIFSMFLGSTKNNLGDLEVNSLSVVNKDGIKLLKIGSDEFGGLILISDMGGEKNTYLTGSDIKMMGGRLTICNKEDNPSTVIDNDEFGGSIYNWNKNGKVTTSITNDKLGGSIINYDKNHTVSTVINNNNYGGSISNFNNNGAFSTVLNNNEFGGMITNHNNSGSKKSSTVSTIISTNKYGGVIINLNSNEETSTSIENRENGGQIINYDKNNKYSTAISCSDQGGFVRNFANGLPTFQIENDENGGLIGLNTIEGKTAVGINVEQFELFNKHGNVIAEIQTDKDGNGIIGLFDQYGTLFWGKSK